ncbi:MAG: hypothetical protein ACRYG5_02865 [Janthinobacterium lividum]
MSSASSDADPASGSNGSVGLDRSHGKHFDAASRSLQYDILHGVRKLIKKRVSPEAIVRVNEIAPCTGRYKVKTLQARLPTDQATLTRYLRGQRLAADLAGLPGQKRVSLGELSHTLEATEQKLEEQDRQRVARIRHRRELDARAKGASITRRASDAILCTDAGAVRLNDLIKRGAWQECLGAELSRAILADLAARRCVEFISERSAHKAAIERLCARPISDLLSHRQRYYAPGGARLTTYRGSAVSETVYQRLMAAGPDFEVLVRPAALFETDQRRYTALPYQDFHQSGAQPHRVLYEVIGHSSCALEAGESVADARERLYSFLAVFSVIGHQRVEAGASSYTQIALRECSERRASVARHFDSVLLLS